MSVLEDQLQAPAAQTVRSSPERGAKQTTLRIVNDCDERRNRVAYAVLGAVAREGVHGVTIRNAASDTGWSVGVISQDFCDRRELLLAGLRAATQTFVRRMRETAAIGDPIDRVLGLLEAGMPLDEERIATCRIFYHFQAEGIADDALRAELARNYTAWRAAVCEAIADAQADDHFAVHDASELAESLVGLAEGLGIHGMFDPKAMPAARLRKRLAHAIEHLAEGSPFGL